MLGDKKTFGIWLPRHDGRKNSLKAECIRHRFNGGKSIKNINKELSYRREIALQGGLVLAKSGRLELGDNILRTL